MAVEGFLAGVSRTQSVFESHAGTQLIHVSRQGLDWP